MKLIIASLLVCGLTSAFPGSTGITLSRKEFLGDRHPYAPERLFVVDVVTFLELSERLSLTVEGGYGSGEPAMPDSVEEGLVSNLQGRLWEASAGLDYTFAEELFFARVSAGPVCLVRNYVEMHQGSSTEISHSKSEWNGSVEVGAGSRFAVADLPVIESIQVMVSWQSIGSDHSLFSAGLGFCL